MNKRSIQTLVAIVFVCAANSAIFAAIPQNIVLKNNTMFDIVYKPMFAVNVVYQQRGKEERSYEENLIQAGTGKVIPTYGRQPIQLSIKRYGYGSGLSSWVDVTDPDTLARAQLSSKEYSDYEHAIGQGRMPIITIKSSYTGGWAFSIGYMK